MRHDHLIEGPGHRLRPVHDGDAAFIAALRAHPALSRHIHAGDGDVRRQLDWLRAYYDRPGDLYWVVEPLVGAPGGAAEGVISVYDVDAARREAEWGRWVLRPGSLAAVESAWLVYRAAFERIGLDAVFCRTLADNAAVVSFHDSCGIPERRVLPKAVELRGARHDVVEHRLTAAQWPAVSQRLAALAERVARTARRRVPAAAAAPGASVAATASLSALDAAHG